MDSGPFELGDEAIVLRRVWASQCPEGARGRPPLEGFFPSSKDTDGLSVWVEGSVPYEWFETDPAKMYFVARIRVGDVGRRGMTFVQTGAPGHYVIPEINRPAYDNKATKTSVKTLMEALTFCCDLVGPFPRSEDLPAQDDET